MRIELWVEEIRAVPVHRRLRAVRRRGAGQPGPLGAGAVRPDPPGAPADHRPRNGTSCSTVRAAGRRGVTRPGTAEPGRRGGVHARCRRGGGRGRLPGPAGPAGSGAPVRLRPAGAPGRIALVGPAAVAGAGGPDGGRRAGRRRRRGRHGGSRGAARRAGARRRRAAAPPGRPVAVAAAADAEPARWRRCPLPSCAGSRTRRRAPCGRRASRVWPAGRWASGPCGTRCSTTWRC